MLRVTLAINDDVIGDYEVRNTGVIEEGFHVYEVRQIHEESYTGPVLTTVHHRREKGAMWLTTKVILRLTALLNGPDGRPSTESLLGIAPDWCGGQSVDDYIDDIRRE